jgi:hypothetical protein
MIDIRTVLALVENVLTRKENEKLSGVMEMFYILI